MGYNILVTLYMLENWYMRDIRILDHNQIYPIIVNMKSI